MERANKCNRNAPIYFGGNKFAQTLFQQQSADINLIPVSKQNLLFQQVSLTQMDYYKSGKACVCVTVIFIKGTTVKRMIYVFSGRTLLTVVIFLPLGHSLFISEKRAKKFKTSSVEMMHCNCFNSFCFNYLLFIHLFIHSISKRKSFIPLLTILPCLGFTKTIKNTCLCTFSTLYISMKQNLIYTCMLAVFIFQLNLHYLIIFSR